MLKDIFNRASEFVNSACEFAYNFINDLNKCDWNLPTHNMRGVPGCDQSLIPELERIRERNQKNNFHNRQGYRF